MKLQVTYETRPHETRDGRWTTDILGVNGKVVGRGYGSDPMNSMESALSLSAQYEPNTFLADEVFA